jgi:hypothetical protein
LETIMPSRTSRFAFRAGLAVLALTACATAGARADTIDTVLLKNSGKLMTMLRESGYKNVGVLKFQVEKSKDAPTFYAGRLPTFMATRLENVLILANDVEVPIGITRSASAVAGKRDQNASYDTAEARAKLFEGSYPLAWGKDDVKVDAFLTGLVKLSPDFKETTVIVRAFDPKKLEPRDLLAFTVPTTRSLLSDMDQGFLIAKRELNKLLPIEEKEPEKVAEAAKKVPAAMDQIAVETSFRADKTTPDPRTEPMEQVLDFRVFFDGKEVKRDATNRIPTPQEGQKVHFTLRSPERLGVVLRVNGVNTSGADAEERDANQYSMWVLQPNKDYTIKGFYKENGDMIPFKVLGDLESANYKLADETKRGQIELFLFRQVQAPIEKVELPDVKLINFRQSAPRVETVEAAQNQVLALKGPRTQGLIVPAEPLGKVTLNQVPFNNVELAGHFTIGYLTGKR